MGDILRVEHLEAEPGKRQDGYLTVGEMQDNSPVRLPVVLVNGAEPGRTLYLQATSDGDELNGIAVIRRVLKRLDPAVLRGRVIATLIVNFHAFHAGESLNPVDGKKMNRCFPGRKEGTSSERVAYRLFHGAVKQSDYCIDLHQGGVRPMIDEVRVRVDRRKRIHRACMEMARVFDIGYILDCRGPDGQLARAAPDEGIPTIDPELGGCHGWDEGSIRKGVVGVENIFKHFRIYRGPGANAPASDRGGRLPVAPRRPGRFRGVSGRAIRSSAKGRPRGRRDRSVRQGARNRLCPPGIHFLGAVVAADGRHRRGSGHAREEYTVRMSGCRGGAG